MDFMKDYIKELFVLFLSIVKWIFLSICVGILVGVATSIFLKLLGISCSEVKSFSKYYFLLVPFALVLSSFIVKKFAPDAKGHGTEKVIEAIHKKNGAIDLMVVPIKLIATVITIAFGGSAGKEGPSAQIGAGLTSFFAKHLKINDKDKKKLVVCGISAGFASVFGTPIAAAIFAVEVLFVGNIIYELLLPSFISSIIAIQITNLFKVHHLDFDKIIVNEVTINLLLKSIFAGLFFAFVSFLLVEALIFSEKISSKIKINSYLKAFIAGLVLVAVGLIFTDFSLGLGANSFVMALNNENIHWYDFLLKIFTTATTLSFGGSGGILTPIFFIGSTSGVILDKIFSTNGIFVAIGFVSLLSGAANTPIAASILAVELFGSDIIPFSTLSCIICFLFTGHRSVYPTQILAMKKAQSLSMILGKEIKETNVKDIKSEKFDKYFNKFF